MLTPQFRQSLLPRGELREFRAVQFKIVSEAFLELFELLEEYAPVWYTEQLHNRAVAAKRILPRYSGSHAKTDNAPPKA